MAENLHSEIQKIAAGKWWVKKLYLAEKSPTWAYIRYRILRPLLKLYYKFFKWLNPGSPWTTPASIAIFNHYLTPTMTGLEYGSGRSTLYFARRLGRLVSIEHHPGWYEQVSRLLQEQGLNHVEYLLIPEKGANSNETKAALTARLNRLTGTEERPEFADYYNKVLEYPEAYFDFVLIDGRARVKCGLNAISRLKKGGMFVLDNSERPRYRPLHEALRHWPRTDTTTGLTNTTIWIKP